MVDTVDEVGAKPSRINLGDVVEFLSADFVFNVHHRQINRLAVRGGRDGDVVFVFVAAFDLKAGNADVDQFGNLLDRVKVTRRK